MEALPRRLLELGERGALLDYGIVDSADPLTVKIGGSTIAVPAVPLDSYYPEVGDYVAVLTHGADLLVLGRASPTRMRLRLAATNDVSHTSTAHAFQIGPDSGPNLRMDVNEVLATNNGSPATLFIQADAVSPGAVELGRHDSTAVVVGGQNMLASTTSTPTVSSASGFTVSSPAFVRVTPNFGYVQFTITNNTGSPIGPGDISNTTVGTVTAGDCLGTLNRSFPIMSTTAGSAVGLYNPSNGAIRVLWMVGTWANGGDIALHGWVALN